jgi:hypothetical protein
VKKSAEIRQKVRDGVNKGKTFHKNLKKAVKKAGGADKFERRICKS